MSCHPVGLKILYTEIVCCMNVFFWWCKKKCPVEWLHYFLPLMGPLVFVKHSHVDVTTKKKLRECIFCFVFHANHSFCPVERPVSVPCVFASQCAILSGKTKQLAARRPATVKKHRRSYDVSHQKLCLRLCQSTCDFFFCRWPLRLHGGLDAMCRLSTAFFPTYRPNFSSQRHLLWLAAFQAEIPLAWKRNPGNKQLRINLAQLCQRGGSRKWDIKSLAVGAEEGERVW